MKKFLILTTIILLMSACVPQSELEEAKKRIAELEAELVIAKSNTLQPTAKIEAANKPVSEPEPVTQNSKWEYSQIEDKMSGGVAYHASILSSNQVEFDFPYAGTQHGVLTLRTDPKYGKDVIFRIERGQLLCNSYDGCNVLVRFDDEKPTQFSAVGPADNSTETIFIHNYNRFVEKMLKAKRVRISLNIYQQGAPVFEFDVGDFEKIKYKPNK